MAKHGRKPSSSARATIAEFEAWMRQAGMWWNEELIAIEADAQTGAWRVAARRAIVDGDLLAAIPKTAVLSASNSSIADVLAEEGIGAGLALTIAAMHEHCLGERSKWCVFFVAAARRRAAGGDDRCPQPPTQPRTFTTGTATCAPCPHAST